MKKKYLLYGIMPMFLLGLAGVGTASAQGWFARNANIDPVVVAGDQEDRFAQEAAVLGISIEQVKDFWAQGKSPRDIIDELKLDETAIQSRMQAERQANMKTHVQALVDQGVITQAQADQRLEYIQNNEGKFTGRGEGIGRHGGGMRGMGMDFQGAQ
jgi:hypothetical protein